MLLVAMQMATTKRLYFQHSLECIKLPLEQQLFYSPSVTFWFRRFSSRIALDWVNARRENKASAQDRSLQNTVNFSSNRKFDWTGNQESFHSVYRLSNVSKMTTPIELKQGENIYGSSLQRSAFSSFVAEIENSRSLRTERNLSLQVRPPDNQIEFRQYGNLIYSANNQSLTQILH